MSATPAEFIEHLGLAAKNSTALKDWYCLTLGAEMILQLNPEPPAFMLRFPGGALMEIYQATNTLAESPANNVAGLRHLAWSVANIETAKAALEKKGIAFTEPIRPAGGGGRVLFFKDMEGNLLHLVERPESSPLHSLRVNS